MAHLCFVVPRFHTNLFHATAALIAAGHRVSVLANVASDQEDHRHVVPEVLGRQPAPGGVAEALRRLSPDLVLIRTAHDLSRQAAKAARALRLTALRYDLMPLGTRGDLKQRLLRVWRGLPAGRVTPVREIGSRAERVGAARYLPWPVASDVVVPEAVLRAQPVPVVCVGKFGNPRKNHLALIAALEALGGGAAVRLTLVGSLQRTDLEDGAAYYAQLRDVVARYDWIEMRVQVPYAEMPALYARHAVCVLPSYDEPLGISPVEAMACGTIPVISAQSGSAGYLTDGVDGRIVDLDRSGALQAALADVLGDAERRVAMSAATRATVARELSPERFVARVEDLLAQL